MSKYTELITNYHVSKPNFFNHIDLITRPFVDLIKSVSALNHKFSIDNAVGDQLDAVGKWVGRGRGVAETISDVYFSFDTEGLGFDQGTWKGKYDPDSGLAKLSDDVYRLVLRAQVAINCWDGTVGGLEDILENIFTGSGIDMQILDNEDMTITINAFAINGIENTSAELLSVIESGYLNIKPAGVRVKSLNIVDAGRPVFGLDFQSNAIAGFDTGYWS